MHNIIRDLLQVSPVALIVLPIAAGLKRKSWLRFLIAIPLTLVEIVLPLFVFSLSCLMVPESRQGIQHIGWVSCFPYGKMALAPLVLWALAALYAIDVYRVDTPAKPWIAIGMVNGIVVSTVCLVFGLFLPLGQFRSFALWLLVPAGTALWFWFRGIRIMRAANLSPRTVTISLLCSTPLWYWVTAIARWHYARVPEYPNTGCFIVTAASRGHACVVGPLRIVRREGRTIRASSQLLTFWRCEEEWARLSPQTHGAARRVYNRLGPEIASRIRSQWTADCVYYILKPCECVAKIVVRNAEKRRTMQSSLQRSRGTPAAYAPAAPRDRCS